MVSGRRLADLSVEQLYDLYLYNLHQMINKLNYKWEWARVSTYRFTNFGEYDVADFSRLPNPYLLEYQNEKIKLAKDILENGMYFPFYGGKLDNPINPELYFILQGKHRLYSLTRYSEDVDFLWDEFLFITYPIDIQYFRMFMNRKENLPEPIQLYDIDWESGDIVLETFNLYTETLKVMDRLGGAMGNHFFELRKQGIEVKAPSVLNNKDEFNEFINSEYILKEEVM